MALASDAQLRVARAIHRMRREGVGEEQAEAKAEAMEARGRLDRDGRYIRVPSIHRPAGEAEVEDGEG